jgi:hypothetical protein
MDLREIGFGDVDWIHNTVSYRTFVSTSFFLQVFNMAATGYATDSYTIF